MVTFRCKRSGNTVSFDNEQDIKDLRRHEGYEEVAEREIAQKQEECVNVEAPTLKRVGRPKKH